MPVFDLYNRVNSVVIHFAEVCSIMSKYNYVILFQYKQIVDKGDYMAEKTYKVVKRTEYENRGKAPVYIDTSEILRDS